MSSSLLFQTLRTKEEIDQVIIDTEDLVVVLRFGRETDSTCLELDEVFAKTVRQLENMARIYLVDVDSVPEYVKFFDITLIPATIFFFNTYHMKCDYGTKDHTKWIGPFFSKQDFIDLVECFYRGAMKGKFIISSPITDPTHVPKYTILYKDI